jgi:hypothetical protein
MKMAGVYYRFIMKYITLISDLHAGGLLIMHGMLFSLINCPRE